MITDNKTLGRKIIGVATVECDLLNIRRQASTTGQILKTAPKGTQFNVVEGGNKTFTAIAVDDVVAYAMTKFLKVTINQ